MAQLIVERNTIINHILPEEGRDDTTETHQTLKSLISLYNSYLKKAKEPQKEGYSWVRNVFLRMKIFFLVISTSPLACFAKFKTDSKLLHVL